MQFYCVKNDIIVQKNEYYAFLPDSKSHKSQSNQQPHSSLPYFPFTRHNYKDENR